MIVTDSSRPSRFAMNSPAHPDHDCFSAEMAPLAPLREQMARRVHEVWMEGRLAEGWRYGPQRDDAQRTHPSLVPYDELPESEKDYDRHTSQETLKFILSQGFQITKRDQ